MYFKHPEILYALFALIIPVIIHLFQLQRFEKTPFTNVKLLKQIEQESRKSSTLKKWLILISRLLLLTALIMAFAQPYFAKNLNKKETETIIYLDNSLSMQVKGKKGTLLQSSIRDLIENYKNSSKKVTLITNDKVYKDIRIDQDLLNIKPVPFQKELKQVLLQIASVSAENKQINKNILLITDLQGSPVNNLRTDSLNKYYIIGLKPVKAENIFIDTVWVAEKNNENIKLKALIRNFNTPDKNINVSLFLNNVLEGKTSITSIKNQSKEVTFTLSNDKIIQGTIRIDASDLLFDNTRYFSLNSTEKTRVLSIGKKDVYLEKIYNNEDFIYSHRTLRSLDYNLINTQDLIILNRIENINRSLTENISTYLKQGKNLVIIPDKDIDLNSYNTLFSALDLGKIKKKVTKRKLITKINYKDPFFKNVFQKKISNFQYPSISIQYPTDLKNAGKLLICEDQEAFISRKKNDYSNIYWISSPLTPETTSFINSPLIIPVFYNFSLKNITQKGLYLEIGKDNIFEIPVSLRNNEVIHLVKGDFDFIPRQLQRSDKLIIETRDKPIQPGIYQAKSGEKNFTNIAYNYSDSESILQYTSAQGIINKNRNVYSFNDLNAAFLQLNEQNKTKDLWQLFLIFALIFLIIEILLQRLL